MKKQIIIPAAACILAAALSAAALTGCARETPDVPAEPSAAADHTAGRLSEEAQPEPEEESASEPPTPALTLEEVRTVSFSDVPPQDARADFAGYAVFRGFLRETEEGRFSPDAFAVRGELMAALWRMSGQEAPDYNGAFTDVSAGDPWAGAVTWAVQSGVAAGTAEDSFSPQASVSRSQLAVFLCRLAGQEETVGASLTGYRDAVQVPEYARKPMAWALKNRLFAGMVSDTVHPELPVSRGQLAQVLTALAACREEEPVARELSAAIHFPAAESASQAHHQEIQEKVDATAAKYGAVGLQVAVIEDGRVTDTYAYGWATKGTDRMTPDHKTRIASITKVEVGLAAMALYEDGVIDLDGSIGTYWGVSAKNPYYPGDPVSIRTLLTHTSSIPALGDDTSRARWAVQDRLQSGGFSRVRPGATSSWIYNNYAYGVLGQTLEIASGKFLDDVMEEHFWEIMEIDGAFESGNVKNKDLLCTVYQYGSVGRSLSAMRSNTRRYSPPGATGAYFSGGMTMSAADLGKMTALLANDGCYEGLQLLKASTVELMEQRCEPQLPDGSWQALSLRSQDGLYGRDRLYYHTGSAYGVFNCMSYDPDTRDGVVVLTSGASGAQDGRGIYAVCGEISRYIYDTIA